mmetsp:Transcript_18170/g.42480  ORF Transcript_18170/g.42480 Transcript_18170/m.42480 type:complete len:256 (-) Transcript_18170:116-883(-)
MMGLGTASHQACRPSGHAAAGGDSALAPSQGDLPLECGKEDIWSCSRTRHCLCGSCTLDLDNANLQGSCSWDREVLGQGVEVADGAWLAGDGRVGACTAGPWHGVAPSVDDAPCEVQGKAAWMLPPALGSRRVGTDSCKHRRNSLCGSCTQGSDSASPRVDVRHLQERPPLLELARPSPPSSRPGRLQPQTPPAQASGVHTLSSGSSSHRLCFCGSRRQCSDSTNHRVAAHTSRFRTSGSSPSCCRRNSAGSWCD